MVKTETKRNAIQQKLYFCSECGLKYRDEKTAEKCEEWCRKHHTCNIELIKHAVE